MMDVRRWVAALGALGVLCGGMGVGCDGAEDALRDATAGENLVELSSTSLDFGSADCGGDAPSSQEITLKNRGDTVLRWTASIDSNVFFALAGETTGELEPGQSTTVVVAPGSMPSDVAAGAVLTGTVLITTNDTRESQIHVPLRAVARGATFELVTPELADFGKVPLSTQAPEIPVLIRNVGNAPAAVTIAQPSDEQFSFSWKGGDEGIDLEPGAAIEGLVARFVPTSIGPSAAVGLVSVDGPTCGQSAGAIKVKGQGLGGDVGVSPANIDLGKIACGTVAEVRKVAIYNEGNAPYSWSARMEKGDSFTLSHEAGSILPGGLDEIFVYPKPIGMTENVADNGFGDTLVITTDVPGLDPIEVDIAQTAAGAILRWTSEEALDFDRQQLFAPSNVNKKLELVNDGNAPAEVVFQAPTGFATTPETATVMGGGDKLEVAVAYAPTQFEPQDGNISVSVDTALCQPFNGQVSVSGAGGKAVASAIAVGGGVQKSSPAGYGGCAILDKSDGRVVCFGTNEHGQLGRTGGTGMNVVPGLSGVVSIASGGDFNCAVDTDGAVWCWGNNRNRRNNVVGKLGKTSGSTSATPVQVENVPAADKVFIGHNIACAVTKTGTVWCWGVNRRGNLGNGSHGSHANAPLQLSNLSDITSLGLGAGGGCALRNDNTVWCWGYYQRGQVGSGSSSGTTVPVQVSSMTDAVGIMSNSEPAKAGARCALRSTGVISCWGNRRYGQLGEGSNTSGARTTPINVTGISTALDVAGNHIGGCALLNDNTVKCWGRNRYGQVGDGTSSARLTPVAVQGIDDATAIAAGGRATCAIVTGGSVKCWGNYGIDSSTTPKTLPNF